MTQGGPHDSAEQALADAQACLDRGALDAGLAAATRAAALATDDASRARAGWLQAQFTYRRGDYAGVLALVDTLTPMLRTAGGDSLREFLRMVVFAGAEIGRFDLALPAAYEVHALAEANGQPGPRSQALNAFGICFERMGDPWQGERLLREALAVARAGAPLRDLFTALNNLSAVLIGAYYLQRGSEVSAASLAALERRREYGLLMALGARRSRLWRLILLEYAIVAFGGGALGALISACVGAAPVLWLVTRRTPGETIR